MTTSYGVLYYGFPVLAPQISDTTGWSTTAVTAAFSAALLLAALVGVPVGRWLDHHGPRGIMTAGSALSVLATVLIAIATSLPLFIAAWLLAGIAMAAVFYPPAFTALTRWYGAQHVGALTWLTLAAGLASTVFAPTTAHLLQNTGWRHTYLILAGVLAVVTVPTHWWGLRGPWPETRGDRVEKKDTVDARGIARSLPFVAISAALSLTTFAAFAAVVNLVPLLLERGLDSGGAALALGLGGAGQAAGRLAYPLLVRFLGVGGRTLLILATTSLTIALLGLLTGTAALITAAIGAGMTRGLLTLLQATAVSDRWGTRHYGRLTGLLSAPVTLSFGLGPGAGAVAADVTGSYASGFLLLATLGLAGTACLIFTTRSRDPEPS